MHIRSYPRALFGGASIYPQLRGPTVTWSPDEDAAPSDPPADPPPSDAPSDSAPAPEGDPAPAPEGGSETPPDPKPNTDWAHRRIDRLTARASDAERRARELAEENARLRAIYAGANGEEPPGSDNAPANPPTLTEAEIERRAQELVSQQTFKQRLESVGNAGKGEFGADGWNAALQNLARAGILADDNLGLLTTALELDKPQAVLHHLGQNPDEAERIAALPVARMAIELDRLAAKIGAPPPPPKVSNVPPPMAPIGGDRAGNGVDLYDPNVSSESWFAQRERELAAKHR